MWKRTTRRWRRSKDAAKPLRRWLEITCLYVLSGMVMGLVVTGRFALAATFYLSLVLCALLTYLGLRAIGRRHGQAPPSPS